MKTTKTIQLTDEERNTIYNAIITTQNLYADKCNGNAHIDEYFYARIDELESILHKFITGKFDK
jgi:hypothetical protein